MRKFLIIPMLLLMILTAGCQSRGKTPNAGRGSNYKYDFIDYVDITVYGQNGRGYIEIKPKTITVNDFDSESDYIKVKHDLEEYNFYFIQGMRSPSGFSISKTTQLSNGDIVTITPKDKEIRSNMNVEAYDYVVEGLGDAEIIDLFSSELITIYALKDGTYGVYLKNNLQYSEELRDHLVYTLSTKDEPVPGQAVVNLKVDLDDEFLKAQNCASITIYLAKHNQRASTETEKVLNVLIEPIDMSVANSAAIESLLYKELYKNDEYLAKICNIQQLERQRSSEPYTYTVVYYDSKDGVRTYYRRDMKIIAIDGNYQVTANSGGTRTEEAYATAPYDGAVILIDYMYESTQPQAEPVTVEDAAAETAEGETA